MNNKVVLVTGSSIGLGASIIEKYAKEGYNTVITYVTHEKEALELKGKIEKQYHIKSLVIKCDITNENEIKEMFNKIINEFGKIDVLVNNAGIAIDSTFEDKTKESFMKILEVNLVGMFLVSRVFGDFMFNNKKGNIINISSTNAIDTYYEYSLDYDASKAGVINLTHNLSNHYAPFVRVNTICPGWIDTPMNKEINDEERKNYCKNIKLNRFAEPFEIANIVYFVSSDEASYINDSIIRVDGGERC